VSETDSRGKMENDEDKVLIIGTGIKSMVT
jgi:hypothetical protein